MFLSSFLNWVAAESSNRSSSLTTSEASSSWSLINWPFWSLGWILACIFESAVLKAGLLSLYTGSLSKSRIKINCLNSSTLSILFKAVLILELLLIAVIILLVSDVFFVLSCSLSKLTGITFDLLLALVNGTYWSLVGDLG